MKLVVGISGSSGAIYGIRMLEVLASIDDVETHLVLSPSARLTITAETDLAVAEVEALADEVYGFKDIAAPIASCLPTPSGMTRYPNGRASRGSDVAIEEERVTMRPQARFVHLAGAFVIEIGIDYARREDVAVRQEGVTKTTQPQHSISPPRRGGLRAVISVSGTTHSKAAANSIATACKAAAGPSG